MSLKPYYNSRDGHLAVKKEVIVSGIPLFVASILQQWRQQQEAEELTQACLIVDELELGWTEEWQTAAIINSEALWLK